MRFGGREFEWPMTLSEIRDYIQREAGQPFVDVALDAVPRADVAKTRLVEDDHTIQPRPNRRAPSIAYP